MVQLYRASNTFKSATVTLASNVPVWTPAAGKKFRLLRVYIDVTADVAAATAGPLTVSLLDASAQFGIARSVFVPAAAGATAEQHLVMDLGPDGYVSSNPNNVLNGLLSRALTSGTIRVDVMGVEE